VHQIWLPYHWGSQGLVTGDAVNDLFGVALDPNVLIQDTKVATCDIRPGRRPHGAELVALVESYRRRASVTVETGTHLATGAPHHPSPGDHAISGSYPQGLIDEETGG
jgi:formate dehydrogenase major subunit